MFFSPYTMYCCFSGYEQPPVPMSLSAWLAMICCARRQSYQAGEAPLPLMRSPTGLPRQYPGPAGQHLGQDDRLLVQYPGAKQQSLPPCSRRFPPHRSAAQSAHRTDPAWISAGLAARSTHGARVSLATHVTPGAPAVRPRFGRLWRCPLREWPLNDSDSQQWDTGLEVDLSDGAERYPASPFQTTPLPVPSSTAR